MILRTLALLALLGLFACSTDDDSPPATGGGDIGTPTNEHHPNDGSTNNPSTGGKTVTLGNIDFDTKPRDFSGEPVVNDPRTVSATSQATWSFDAFLREFRIDGDRVIGYLEVNAFNTQLIVYSLTNRNMLSTHAPDFNVSGMDYNGVIMTVDGGEDLNFYRVSDAGVIDNHFFQVNSFVGSKFLSTPFLDDDRAFVYNADEILMFPIHDTKNVAKLMDVPSFSRVHYTADEDYVYVSIADFNASEIRFIRKPGYTLEKTVQFPNRVINGFTVDANYFYMGDAKAGKVYVQNKRTDNPSGEIDAPGVHAVHIVGDMLYLFHKDTRTLEQYQVSFN